MPENIDKLKIVHLSKYNQGAIANVVNDIHSKFRKMNFDSYVFVNHFDINGYHENVINLGHSKIKRKLRQIIKKKLITQKKYHFFNEFDLQTTYISTKKIVKFIDKIIPKPDAMFVYQVNNFLNARNLYELSDYYNLPLFWYMMDCGPITGGCHYSWDCNGYRNNCGNCPALYSKKEQDISFKNLLYKKKYLSSKTIIPIAPTSWLRDRISNTSLFKNSEIELILLPTDHNLFKPRNSEKLRIDYQIDKNAIVLLLGSFSLTDERKGMSILLDALHILDKKLQEINFENPLHLIIVGKNPDDLKEKIPFKYSYMGYVPLNKLAELYNVADCFLSPSLEDAGPSMVNQSILSGTPVISFSVGVARDLVENNQTGFISEEFTALEFSNKILKFLTLDKTEKKMMKKTCRELGLEKMSGNKFNLILNKAIN